MDIQKEFDRWWNTFKSQATRQYPVKAAREAWAACAMLMADENEKLKKEMVTFVGYSKYIENQHLQSKLDEAVEIIKTISKNANHYDKIDLQNKAEQFLSSLDKIKEE